MITHITTTPIKHRGCNEVRYTIIASCMTPRGAWAKTVTGSKSDLEAMSFFKTAPFLRPESGIASGFQVTLVKVAGSDRELFATRYA